VEVAQKYGVRVILHSRNSKANKFSAVMHKLNFKKIDSIRNEGAMTRLAVSDVAGKWMFGLNGKYQVLNNGIEISRFRYDEAIRNRTREILGIKNETVYGNVGAFLEAKNHEFILQVFKDITTKSPDAILLLVGDGLLREDIEKQSERMGIKDKILFMGIRKDIPELLMAMDCLIFPSIYEGFPNVILEAQTTGLPVVMSTAVTNEVQLLETCKRKDLDEQSEKWAEECMVQASGKCDRNLAWKVADDAGFSTLKEIEKLEAIYDYRSICCN
jgi:glycosyltransferase involved in cell wall biosynthesis